VEEKTAKKYYMFLKQMLHGFITTTSMSLTCATKPVFYSLYST